MKKRCNLYIFILLFIISTINISFAKRFSLELEGSSEKLYPNDIYGNWSTLYLRFYHYVNPEFTYFIETDHFSRDKEGKGNLFVLGAYKDWSDNLYTYTDITFSTKCSYLPKFRFDHEFNFKFGKEKNIVLTAGFSYIDYYDVHKDIIYYPGLTYYGQGFSISYKHFFNINKPGNIKSGSDLISIEFGLEGKSITNIDYSYGQQAYLATYLVNPEEVRQDTSYISLKHKQWLSKDYGFSFRYSYLNIASDLEKYEYLIGFFKEF